MSRWHIFRDLENRLILATPAREEDAIQGTPFSARESPWAIRRLVRAAFIVDPHATFALLRSADEFRASLEEAVLLTNRRAVAVDTL